MSSILVTIEVLIWIAFCLSLAFAWPINSGASIRKSAQRRQLMRQRRSTARLTSSQFYSEQNRSAPFFQNPAKLRISYAAGCGLFLVSVVGPVSPSPLDYAIGILGLLMQFGALIMLVPVWWKLRRTILEKMEHPS